MSSSVGLLIGVGSVGRRHAAVMAKRYSHLVVIDLNPEAKEWASRELRSQVTLASSLLEVAEFVSMHSTDVTAVIASWGPHHYPAIKQLVELGVKRMFCEKPLGTSLRELQGIQKLCTDNRVALTAGLHLRYRGITEFINQVSVEHLGGIPSSMMVHGGARCIATNGSHWLDLAIAMFGVAPHSTSAVVSGDKINPRSSSLEYWQGSATWSFSGERRLTISYDNSSSVEETVSIYAPTGLLEIDSDFRVLAFTRNEAEVAADPRMTRVGGVNREFPVAEFTPDFNEVLSVQLDELEGLRPATYGLDAAIESAVSLVAAFESSRLKMHLSLPPTQDVINKSVEWNIS